MNEEMMGTGLAATQVNKRYMPEEEGLQDTSDILMDLLPAGLAATGAVYGMGKLGKWLGKKSSDNLASKVSAGLSRQKEGAEDVAALQKATAEKYPGLAEELAQKLPPINSVVSPMELARKEISAKGYGNMTTADLRKAREELVGNKDIFELDDVATMHRYAIEDAMELASERDKMQRAAKGQLTKKEKKQLRKEKEYEDSRWDDEFDYTDKITGKRYSDGMSREEYLEMDSPAFADMWSKAGYPQLPDNVVDLIAKGKLNYIPKQFISTK